MKNKAEIRMSVRPELGFLSDFGFRLPSAFFLLPFSLSAAPLSTNFPPISTPFPDAGYSVLRVFGALALVLALFLGGAWLLRNWQRLALARGGSPQLKLLEMKSLGNRHVLYVVAYEQQRLLLAASPSGITLVSHLPTAEGAITDTAPSIPAEPPFAEMLQHMLQRNG